MKYIYTIALFIYSTYMFSQSEMIVTEMNSDNDAQIEIAGEDPDASDYVRMVLGFNQSNQAYLRTTTNHDFSLWTNNTRRLTVKTTGDIGIGTGLPLEKLFVGDGRLGLETQEFGSNNPSYSTGINFYTGTSNKASMTYCDCPADGGDLISFNQPSNGLYNFKTGLQSRMLINRDGSVEINDLEGTGQRNVYAEADGTLKTTDEVHYKIVNSSDFQDKFGLKNINYYNTRMEATETSISAIAHPDIHFTKYEIEEITMSYTDNSDENMTFTYRGSLNNAIDTTTTGNINTIRTLVIPINEVIDQSLGQYFSLQVLFREAGPSQQFQNAKIKYRPVY